MAGAVVGDIPDLGHERHGLPLDVLLEALDRLLAHCDGAHGETTAGGHPGADVRSAMDRALAHEERYWQGTAPAQWRDNPRVLRESVALVTLAGAVGQAEAHGLLAVSGKFADPGAEAVRHDLIEWLSSLYGGPGMLGPLRPDLLGERLVAGFLAEQPDSGLSFLGRVLELPSDGQAERCLDMLARLCAYDEPAARTAAAAIRAVHDTLISRAEAQSRGQPGKPGRPDLAGAMQRLLTPRFCALISQGLAGAEPGNAGLRRDLSVTYAKLADLALDGGRPEEAEALYRESLALRSALAEAEPGNAGLRRDLALTYAELADLALDGGRPEEAEALCRESLALRSALVEAEPGNARLRRDLWLTYVKLSELASGNGMARRQASGWQVRSRQGGSSCGLSRSASISRKNSRLPCSGPR